MQSIKLSKKIKNGDFFKNSFLTFLTQNKTEFPEFSERFRDFPERF